VKHSPIFVAFSDLLICLLIYALLAVTTSKHKVEGVKQDVFYVITMSWDVDINADVDIHLMTPSKKPVFFGSLRVGCAVLDHDNVGFPSSQVRLADGNLTKLRSDVETITLRCIEPGEYTLATNLYSYRDEVVPVEHGLKVHTEINKLQPNLDLVWQSDVVLDRVAQTINLTSFNIDDNGDISFSDPPLESITATYQHLGFGSGAPTPSTPQAGTP
jgi:hypothetical protein